MSEFAARIVAWQKKHGRHDLPWQNTRDPYRVWLSEIMLQQTQVSAVIPYYARFLAHFPDIGALAAAEEAEVLEQWAGLGYYARGRNLHRAARLVAERHGGQFPGTAEEIAALPGIGRSTAAAIAVFAFGARAAILDGNVKRVLTRFFGIEGAPARPEIERLLWEKAESLLPRRSVEAYIQGLMDLGSLCCTRARPRCAQCPVKADCVAEREGRQDMLPTPKPARAVPEKEIAFALFVHQRRILLERRPSRGIWGGLLTPPQFDLGESSPEEIALAIHRLARNLGLIPADSPIAPLPAFEHRLSHFRLKLRPFLCPVEQTTPRVAEASQAPQQWLALAHKTRAALPSPIRELLNRLEEQIF
ncbi:MAG: A/G-specific adenine glycosylase [Betaproteobacteria bacterium]|nr:A/G-specific adenine glycosylase [Betaproteobacteria bacterium]